MLMKERFQAAEYKEMLYVAFIFEHVEATNNSPDVE